MLFLILDQHLNRPAFEIIGHNCFHRSRNIIGDEDMAATVFASGVMKQFADSIHFLGSLEGLGVVNDKEQVFVLIGEKTSQKIEADFLHDKRFIPDASPEEFAVIGAVGRTRQCFGFEMLRCGSEKSLEFLGIVPMLIMQPPCL